MTTAPERQAIPDAVKAFLHRQPQGILVDGRWVAPVEGADLAVVNPADEERLCAVAAATAVDVEPAVAAARAALEGPWSRVSRSGRRRLLLRLAELIEQNANELAF